MFNSITTLLLVVLVALLLLGSALLVSAHDVLDLREWTMKEEQGITASEILETHYPKQHKETEDLFQLVSQRLSQGDVEKIAARAAEAKLTCTECKGIVSILEKIAQNKTSTQEALQIADSLCKTKETGEKVKICEDLAKAVLVDLLPAVFRAVKGLAWNVPQTICADLAKVCYEDCCTTQTVPEQIHLNLAKSDDYTSSMSVTWLVQTQTKTPQLVYIKNAQGGGGATVRVVPAQAPRTFTFGGFRGFIYQAVLTGLDADTGYNYTVGSTSGGVAPWRVFRTMPTNIGTQNRPLRVVTIADCGFGDNSNFTIKQINALVEAGKVDMVHHSGDISYADADESHWGAWFRKIEYFASRVPYQVTPGNHELSWRNGTAYKHFLALSAPRAGFGVPDDAMYYYQKVGTVLFSHMDSETWFDTPHIGERQIKWLKNVAAANPQSRQLPWRVATHHRPLYCTHHGTQCGLFADILRLQAEKTYNDLKVDLNFYGHIHTYFRSWPLSVGGKPTQKNYDNPQGPVYMCVGNAGNREGNSAPDPKIWEAPGGSRDIGYTLLEFTSDMSTGHHTMNSTMFRSLDNQVLDHFLLTKKL